MFAECVIVYSVCVSTGMEFLVPKTGFFCKPCNRFFTGVKEAEISHCKTLKHYDNLQVSNSTCPFSTKAVLALNQLRTSFTISFTSR